MRVTIQQPGTHLGSTLMTLPALQALLEAGIDAGYSADEHRLGAPVVQGGSLFFGRYNGSSVADEFVAAAVRAGASPPRARFDLGITATARFAGATVFAPWARLQEKRASFEWWTEHRAGFGRVALLAPPEAAEYVEQFLKAVPDVEHTSEVPGAWRADLAGAEQVVSVDSGTSHLADALGNLLHTVFVGSDPALFTPYWCRDVVMGAPE